MGSRGRLSTPCRFEPTGSALWISEVLGQAYPRPRSGARTGEFCQDARRLKIQTEHSNYGRELKIEPDMTQNF
jgi:hypothetical protein